MYCTTCATPNPQGPSSCISCGAPLPAEERLIRPTRLDLRLRRRLVAGLPLALLVGLLVVGGVQRVNERRSDASVYAEAERVLAAGDLLGARARFAAAGDYLDAPARTAEVDAQLAAYETTLKTATDAYNAGRYDDAIALLAPLVEAFPEDAETVALIEAARADRRSLLDARASRAEATGDWYVAEQTLALLARDYPEELDYATRLNEIRTSRAPFVYARSGSIYVGSTDAYGDQPLVAGYQGAWPVWSPNRAQIAFVTSSDDRGDIAGKLYVVNGDGSGLRWLADDVLPFSWPVWSPDGTKIAIGSVAEFDVETGDGHIGLLTVDVASGVSRDVTGNRYDFATSPTWSPDGRQIAFIDRKVSIYSGGLRIENGDVWIVDVESGRTANLTGNQIQEERQVFWSPAGDRVAVITDPGDWNNQSPSEIYLVDIATGEPSLVPTGPRPSPPVWSPDGSQIAFVEGDRVVRVWSERASHWIPLDTSIDSYVSWSPDGAALVVTGLTVAQPSYIVSLASGAEPPRQFRLTFDSTDGDGGPPVWAPRTAEADPAQAAGTALDPVG
jgi:Tol biopolymer transport system component